MRIFRAARGKEDIPQQLQHQPIVCHYVLNIMSILETSCLLEHLGYEMFKRECYVSRPVGIVLSKGLCGLSK